MTSSPLRIARQQAGLSQNEAAARLGVSQPYYSQLEGGSRSLPRDLAPRAVRRLSVSPSVLPLPPITWHWTPVVPGPLASALAALGYPPFDHLRKGAKAMNPAMVVVGALAHSDLEVRIVEALPWVLATFEDLDAAWLTGECRLLNLQNRLGFLISLAVQIDGGATCVRLRQLLAELEPSRLAAESTLCRESMPQAERAWVREHRSLDAAHWGLLTTLAKEQLSYAA